MNDFPDAHPAVDSLPHSDSNRVGAIQESKDKAKAIMMASGLERKCDIGAYIRKVNRLMERAGVEIPKEERGRAAGGEQELLELL